MQQIEVKNAQADDVVQDLVIETFEIEELRELDATAAILDSVSLCSSTTSSSCG